MSKADTTMPPLTSNEACRKCGSALGRFASGQVCARCLLEAGLSDSAFDGHASDAKATVVVRQPAPSLGRFGRYELLEEICLKCLEKDPQRRYASADALAEELEHWLRHEPIRARPSAAAERLGKWIRRNPKVATLLVLLNLVFIIGLGGILIVSVRLASANRAKEQVNAQPGKNVRDFEWQKIDELIATGKRADALAYLSAFLRRDPNDRAAANRLVSMLSECNFALPTITPLQHGAGVTMLEPSKD